MPVINKLICAKSARERCGGKSNMTLHRWINDERMGFPRPVYINGRRYFVETEIEGFIEAQASRRLLPPMAFDAGISEAT